MFSLTKNKFENIVAFALKSCIEKVFIFRFFLEGAFFMFQSFLQAAVESKFECKYIKVGNRHLFSYLWSNTWGEGRKAETIFYAFLNNPRTCFSQSTFRSNYSRKYGHKQNYITNFITKHAKCKFQHAVIYYTN